MINFRRMIRKTLLTISKRCSMTFLLAFLLNYNFPYIVLKLSNPAQATLASAVAVLSGSRYQKYTTPTAIT